MNYQKMTTKELLDEANGLEQMISGEHECYSTKDLHNLDAILYELEQKRGLPVQKITEYRIADDNEYCEKCVSDDINIMGCGDDYGGQFENIKCNNCGHERIR